MKRFLKSVFAATLLAVLCPLSGKASEEGCRFFLCIQDSEWPSNGECPPTVIPILHRMKWGAPPPPCPEAGWNGKIGHEPYVPCPPGELAGDTLHPVTCSLNGFGGQDGNNTVTVRFQANMCVKPPSFQGLQQISAKERWQLLAQYGATCGFVISPRPLRDKPYFMDYTNDGRRERVYVKF